MATAAALSPSAPLGASARAPVLRARNLPPSMSAAPPPDWVTVVADALSHVHADETQPVAAALQRIRRARAHELAPLSGMPLLRELLALLKAPGEEPLTVPVLMAMHALCGLASFRSALVSAGALPLLVSFLPRELDAVHSPDRVVDVVAFQHQRRASRGLPDAPAVAALRVLAKLLVCCPPACAHALPAGVLQPLANAAAPEQPMDVRLRAAAALAAIGAWSGPRKAVQIVETPGVVTAMCAVLEDTDERILPDLRSATIDALVAMSHRGHARRILQRFGCDEKITLAARHATLSGDYTAAAKSTVAAGQLTGRSIDEYGFFVDAEKRPSIPNAEDGSPNHSQSALSNIAHKMMQEPYTSVDELNGLEQIVSDDAQQNLQPLSSSQPNSAASEPFATSGVARAKSASPASSAERVPSVLNSMMDVQASLLPQPVFDESAAASPSVDDVSATALVEQPTTSSPRRSANYADPDFDKLRIADDMQSGEQEGADSEDGRSASRSGTTSVLSPLLAFSSATEAAAKRDGANGLLQKTSSQITRESEHGRIWREVIEHRPEMLQRERGRSSRVVAYRELALVPVPPAMRRRLWPILLDTKSLREARPGLYHKLCKAGEGDLLPDDIEHTIQADVTRTMPSHSLFWSGGAQVGVQSLRSVLRAYARYVPTVGYCQGMSSIAAVFLMNAVDEEEAFLMFAQFMSRFQYKKVFAPGFPLMLQWISELKPLVAHYMPQLNLRLERENVSLELYADKWLITALSHNFPHRHLLRVWDLMFLGGSPKIILKACLAVLKQCESRLMKMDFETMMPFLQRGFAEPDAGVLDAKDPEPFVAMMREFRFMRDIPKSQLEASQAVAASASQPPRPEPQQAPQQRRSALCCLPCFNRSATVD